MSRVLLTLLVSSVLLSVPVAHAAAARLSNGGLAVSPAIEQLALGKDQDSTVFDVTVSNDTDAAMAVVVRVDDFTSLNNTGSAQFLNNAGRQTTPHGLAHWMMPGLPQFSLPAHASKQVPVTISGASTMGPGGHYGAVIFGIAPPPVSGQTNQVGAHAEVSALVFLTTDNTGTRSMKIIGPALGLTSLAPLTSVDLLFANTGDTLITPRGFMSVQDGFGREVARGILNTDSGQILPGTNRLYQVALQPGAQWLWPGIYRLTTYYRADGQSTYARQEQQVLYIPGPLLVVMGVIVFIGLAFAVRQFGPARFYLKRR